MERPRKESIIIEIENIIYKSIDEFCRKNNDADDYIECSICKASTWSKEDSTNMNSINHAGSCIVGKLTKFIKNNA